MQLDHDVLLQVDLCGCGKPLRHVGNCIVRTRKAFETRQQNKQLRLLSGVNSAALPVVESLPAPDVKFFSLVIEGDHLRLQQTGAGLTDLRRAILTMCKTLEMKCSIELPAINLD